MYRAFFKCDESKKDNEIFILRSEAARYLSANIKVTVAISNILDIGLNAQIDFENIENLWFEKIYNIYALLQTIPDTAIRN